MESVPLRFDKKDITAKLEDLAPRQRIAFAAAICERLLPLFERFAKETASTSLSPSRRALDRIWEHVTGSELSSRDAVQLRTAIEQATPHSDDHRVQSVDGAISASAALCKTLELVPDAEPDSIVTVAHIARDAVDMEVLLYAGLNGADPGLQQRVDMHPLMQRELTKQTGDLKALLGGEELTRFALRRRNAGQT